MESVNIVDHMKDKHKMEKGVTVQNSLTNFNLPNKYSLLILANNQFNTDK